MLYICRIEEWEICYAFKLTELMYVKWKQINQVTQNIEAHVAKKRSNSSKINASDFPY